MRKLVASVLVLAALGASSGMIGVAHAQKNGGASLSSGPDMAAIDNARRIEENKMRALEAPRKAGLAALQAQDFAGAEQNFAKLLSFDPTTSDASYLMGLAQMGQKKWADAKISLEAAVVNEPKRPDPKARLGVADIMVGDMEGAAKQRTDLAYMASNCGSCSDAKLIAGNLAMIDKVLAAVAPKPAAAPRTCASACRLIRNGHAIAQMKEGPHDECGPCAFHAIWPTSAWPSWAWQ